MGDDNGGREQPAASSSGSGAPTADLVAAVQARLAALGAPRGGDAPGAPAAQQLLFDRASKTQRKARYAFWETQPVVQFDAAAAAPQVRHERACRPPRGRRVVRAAAAGAAACWLTPAPGSVACAQLVCSVRTLTGQAHVVLSTCTALPRAPHVRRGHGPTPCILPRAPGPAGGRAHRQAQDSGGRQEGAVHAARQVGPLTARRSPRFEPQTAPVTHVPRHPPHPKKTLPPALRGPTATSATPRRCRRCTSCCL